VSEIVQIARCPEHGLQGEGQTDCLACEGPVEQVSMIPLDASEDIAQAIRDVSDAAARILDAGLNQRALNILIRDATGVNFREINAVLNILPELGELYTQESE